MLVSQLFHENYNAVDRFVVNQGGTNSGKSVAILQSYFTKANQQKNKLFSVVSMSLPHLKKGAILDFEDIIDRENYGKYIATNKTDHSYTFPTGSVVEFFSVDNIAKAKGPKRDNLFVNEANHISWLIFEQLEIRTRDQIHLDYNPDHEFWAHTKLLPLDTSKFIKSTYRDNPFLSLRILESILERRKSNPAWFRVYGDGEIGSLEGLCYNLSGIVDRVPSDAMLLGYGLDFGYVNDPTALVAVYKRGREIYADELIYETGLSNRRIREKADRLGINMNEVTIADNDKKSIDELKGMGAYWHIKAAEKGPGSIKYGINLVNDYDLFITKRSANLITEQRKIVWEVDMNGLPLNTPKPGNDHGFDGIRYLLTYKLSRRRMAA